VSHSLTIAILIKEGECLLELRVDRGCLGRSARRASSAGAI